MLQQLPNYDFYDGAPPTIELIDRIVTEYLVYRLRQLVPIVSCPASSGASSNPWTIGGYWIARSSRATTS